MPLAGGVVAAVIGGLLVFTSASSVIGTMVVSRSVSSRLTRWVDRAVDWTYQLGWPGSPIPRATAKNAAKKRTDGATSCSPPRRRRSW